MSPTSSLQLHRNAQGRLALTLADGTVHDGVLPVRAFPISAPEAGLSLVSSDGKELAWIDAIHQLPAAMRALIEAELNRREFMPEIRQIRAVSSYAPPSTWKVDTDRGDAEFVLKGEEDIRRVHASTLLIADGHGVQYLIRDFYALDAHSRRLLDRFL
jgi:hypothetical protein